MAKILEMKQNNGNNGNETKWHIFSSDTLKSDAISFFGKKYFNDFQNQIFSVL